MAALGTANATLTIEASEAVTIDDIEITAAGADTTTDRSPSTPSDAGETFEVAFDGTPVDDAETTFTIEVTATDAAGNTATETLTSSVTGYELAAGTATVDPAATDAQFTLTAHEQAANGTRNATVSQTTSTPAGTTTDADQIAGAFIDVADIGLAAEELTNATIRIPLASGPAEEFAPDELVVFHSAAGTAEYDILEPAIAGDDLIVDVDGFSQFAVGGVDDQPPSIDETTIDPGSDLTAADDAVTVTVAYSPVISDIDVSETTVNVSVPAERTDTQITREHTEVVVRDLQPDETVTVDVTVADVAGNTVTTTETLTVDDETAGESPDGTSAGGGAVPDTSTDLDVDRDAEETETTPDDTPAATPADTPPDTPTEQPADTPADTPEEPPAVEDDTPGFGVTVALVALLAGALLAARRRG